MHRPCIPTTPLPHPSIGLGTSTSNEAKEYFVAIDKHRKEFVYEGACWCSSVCVCSCECMCMCS
jgi:hypothetical protein